MDSAWERKFASVIDHPVTIGFGSTAHTERGESKRLTLDEDVASIRKLRPMTSERPAGHVCGEECEFKTFGDLLGKTSAEVYAMGHDPALHVGNCHRTHRCIGRCDEMREDGSGQLVCRLTGRRTPHYVGQRYVHGTDIVGQSYSIYAGRSEGRRVAPKLDLRHNQRSRAGARDGLSIRERREVFPSKWLSGPSRSDIARLRSIARMDPIHSKEFACPVVLLSRSLASGLALTPPDAVAISCGVLRVASHPRARGLSDRERSLVRTIEECLIVLLPSFYRISKEYDGILTCQRKLFAEAYRYVLWSRHRAGLRVLPNAVRIFEMLQLDEEWRESAALPLPTWGQWLSIVETTVRLYKLCRLYNDCGDAGKAQRMSAKDSVLAAINAQAEGWSYRGRPVVERNWLMSNPGYHLKLHKLSSYGVEPKRHRIGSCTLKDSLTLCIRAYGLDAVHDFIYPRDRKTV